MKHLMNTVYHDVDRGYQDNVLSMSRLVICRMADMTGILVSDDTAMPSLDLKFFVWWVVLNFLFCRSLLTIVTIVKLAYIKSSLYSSKQFL